ncbi:MAG TPA: hypothetical protein VMV17_16290 [Streptosporangiaceae bacterium]|nr:hypothetical protein [Streptosporangiaceae bacterium]
MNRPGWAAVPSISLRRQGVPLLLAVSGWAVLGLTLAGGPEPVRIAAVFAFALIAPGLALVRLLPVRDFLERGVLAVALGMSLATLTAEAVAIRHILTPTPVLVVLAAICSAAALAELARG